MPTFADLRSFALDMSDVEESTSYGTSAFKIHKRLIARLREDGVSLAIRATDGDREALPQINPTTFSIPQHYVGSGMLVIDLNTVEPPELERLFRSAVQQVLVDLAEKKQRGSRSKQIRSRVS